MADQFYSLRRVQATLGLSRAVIVGLIDAGFVVPERGPRNEYRFSFRDLMLLRTAHALRQSQVPTARILRSLGRLRARLPAELPLTGLRITAMGTDVVVRDRSGAWQAESGQGLIDFDVAPEPGGIAILSAGSDPAPHAAADPTGADAAFPRPAPPRATPETLFARARALEAADPDAAESAYRAALAIAPAYLHAYLDLGVLLGERGRSAEAAALYAAALTHLPDEPLLHFNHAIALEDQQRHDDALAAYERALALDPALADAHFNAGRLSEQRGDARGALRHFSAYRRLRPRGEGG